MRNHEFIDFHGLDTPRGAGPGFLRIVLLFGSIAVALGLILVPILAEQADRQLTQNLFDNQPDYTMTGSIHRDNSLKTTPSANLPTLGNLPINNHSAFAPN